MPKSIVENITAFMRKRNDNKLHDLPEIHEQHEILITPMKGLELGKFLRG